MAGPTLLDVAKRAQVSKSTVSLVINDSERVHPETAARVWAAIAELNYIPNRAARSLQSGRSDLVGIIVSDITNPYFAELVRTITASAQANQYDVFVFDTDYDPDQLLLHLEHLRGYRPDGLILLTTERTQAAVDRLESLRLPAVLLNWGISGHRVSEVAVNYEPGLAQLVTHLRNLGHRRLAFVSGPAEFYSATARERAFRNVVTAHEDELAPPIFWAGDFRLLAETGLQVEARLRRLPPDQRPTAIIASSDLIAVSILRALQSTGWAVPADVSVAGIDDIAWAAFVTPALTTLRLPRQAMGRLAFDLLKQLIDCPTATATATSVEPRLILRESVGPAPP